MNMYKESFTPNVDLLDLSTLFFEEHQKKKMI